MADPHRTLLDGLHAPGFKPYVALDAAGIPGLLDRLHTPSAPHGQCLYSGALDAEMAAVAPYLVELPRAGAFLDWLLSGWGRHWGVYVRVPEALDFAALRRHLRRLNLVYGPRGEPLLFRWYDPRVLGLVAPTLEAAQLQALFGPVHSFVIEGDSAAQARVLELAGGKLVDTRFPLQ